MADPLNSAPGAGGPVEQAIREKLAEAFDPTELTVINESSMHSVPPGSESHFKVVIVSNGFAGLNLVARHRAVNQVLSFEIDSGIHALSIEARTPAEWEETGGATTDSPECLGGSKAG